MHCIIANTTTNAKKQQKKPDWHATVKPPNAITIFRLFHTHSRRCCYCCCCCWRQRQPLRNNKAQSIYIVYKIVSHEKNWVKSTDSCANSCTNKDKNWRGWDLSEKSTEIKQKRSIIFCSVCYSHSLSTCICSSVRHWHIRTETAYIQGRSFDRGI